MEANIKQVGNYLIDQSKKLTYINHGMVCLCTNTQDGQTYAVKIYNKSICNKLQSREESWEKMEECKRRQLDVVFKIKSPHIVNVMQFIESKNNYYLFMEYYPEGDLERFLQQFRFRQVDARQLFHKILLAYQVLYDHKYVHRDIKPGNILMKNNNPILADFGFTKQIDQQAQLLRNTNQVGTVEYMAPQICQRDSTKTVSCGREVDIWSLGVLYYRILEDAFPFQVNSNNFSHAIQIIKGTPLNFKILLSYESKRVIRSCLKLDFNDRITFPALLDHNLFKVGRQQYLKTENALKELINQLVKQPNNRRYLKQIVANKKSLKLTQQQFVDILKQGLDSAQNVFFKKIFTQYRDYEDYINVKTVQKMFGLQKQEIRTPQSEQTMKIREKKIFEPNTNISSVI